MKIEFCIADSGDVVFTKESNEIKNIINVITRLGTEINLTFSKDDYLHGVVSNVLYNVDAENNEESIKIYVDRNHNNKRVDALEPAKLTTSKLTATKLNDIN